MRVCVGGGDSVGGLMHGHGVNNKHILVACSGLRRNSKGIIIIIHLSIYLSLVFAICPSLLSINFS